jgi:hypothetical protein
MARIGNNNPHDAGSVGILDDDSFIINSAMNVPGVDMTMNPADTAGVDPDFYVKLTGVDMDTDAWAMDTNIPVDNNAIAVGGLKQ